MFALTVLYDHPTDPAAFDAHYDSTHTALARDIPNLQRLTVARPAPAPDGTRPAWHLIATLEFEDQAAFDAGMGSPQGQATVADLAHFAGAGVTLVPSPDTRRIV